MDYLNAQMYAEHCVRVYLHNKFLQSHPHIFRYSKLETRPATPKDYYVPPKIANQCIVSKVSFDETGCQKIACFPKKQNLENCDSDTLILNLGQHYTLACQPACSQISQDLDTEFRNGKCMKANIFKKSFALFPEHVAGSQTIEPMHIGFDLKDGDLKINSSYCKYYGLDFKYSTGECFSQPHQSLAEGIMGTSFYRLMKRSQYQKSKYTLPPIPNYMKNLNEWLEGTVPRSKRKKRSTPDAAIVNEIARDLVVDFGIDLSLDAISKILRKHIPNTLQNISANLYASKYASKITKIAISDMVLKSQFNVTSTLAKTVGTGISVASGLFTVYSILAMIVDLFDPFDFNGVLDKATLQKINNRLDMEYFGSHQKNQEVTPEHVWMLLDQDLSDAVDYSIEKMIEYMEALTPDAVPVQIATKPYNFVKVYRSSILIVLLLLAVILYEYVDYISFIIFLTVFIVN